MLDHAAGLEALVLVVDVLGCVVVLDDLVFHDAHAGLFDRVLGQRDTRLVGRKRRLIEDLVHLLLGVGRKDGLGLAHLGEGALELVIRLDDEVRFLFCHNSPFAYGRV